LQSCEDDALSAERCDVVAAENSDVDAVLDASEQWSEPLSEAQQEWQARQREAAIRAAAACETIETTTTVGDTTTTPDSTTTVPSTTTTLPNTPPGLPVDESAIPPNLDGLTTAAIGPLGSLPGPASDGVAAFRLGCGAVRMNFDDALIYPGQPRRSHLHTYFGNDSVDANSNAESIMNTGGSSCFGGIVNRTAYWVPTLLDTGTNAPVTTFDDIGPHTGWSHTGQWSNSQDEPTSDAMQLYYKSGYVQGVPANAIRRWFPTGLRMIAGNPMGQSPQPHPGIAIPHTGFVCTPPASQAGVFTTETIPAPGGACSPGQLLTMIVRFPQCWNGQDLDSADHRSHMSYGLGWTSSNTPRGCPSSHPVALPELEMHVRIIIPSVGLARLRLSSDTYDGPAGYSAHGDVVFAWDPTVGQSIIDNCYFPTARDCGTNRTGTQQLFRPDLGT
jgi:hypothetical protein